MALDCMILAAGMEIWHWPSQALMLLVLVVGVIFGLVQGYLIAYLEIQPFIVTMAGMFFARGMTAVISTDQVSIVSDKFFTWLSGFRIQFPFGGYLNRKGILQLPYIRITVVVAILVVILIFLMLALYPVRPEPGTQWAATQQSATLMGLDVKKTQLKAYMPLQLPDFHRRHLLLPEHHVGNHQPGNGPGDERHLLSRYRRHAADRRCGKRNRLPVRCADQRYHLQSGADER